jgi:cytochrome c oxidase subunit 2/cytochrome aa3-600 menaquinol oxidase subunit 2
MVLHAVSFCGHLKRLPSWSVTGSTLLVLSGCTGDLSVVDPAGPAATQIATLWWVMLIGSCAILALTLGLIALAFTPAGSGTASTRFWIGGLGLAFPIAVLAALLSYGLIVGERLLPRGDDAVVAVAAEAERWIWRFSYADAPGRSTQNVLHIPAGQPVDVAITTVDVIHSFWVPRLAGKLDAIPGHTNVLRLEADRPGRYSGVSAEFSGDGYLGHRFEVVAHDQAGWQQWLAEPDE